MRQLTVKQKKVLTEALIRHDDVTCTDDLFMETWKELVEINDTEILHQEVNRFITNWQRNRQ